MLFYSVQGLAEDIPKVLKACHADSTNKKYSGQLSNWLGLDKRVR